MPRLAGTFGRTVGDNVARQCGDVPSIHTEKAMTSATALPTYTEHVYASFPSPVGVLRLVASAGGGLAAILWENDNPQRVRLNIVAENTRHPVLRDTARQLQEYFDGRRSQFSLPLDFTGTHFQKQVWQALLRIPFGQTRTYGQIAHEIGNPKSVRAVGAANGKNPISIVAPCHRVIGASGKLTGFAGGLKAKAVLLALEGHGGAEIDALA